MKIKSFIQIIHVIISFSRFCSSPFSVMAFNIKDATKKRNEEAADCINKDSIGAINEAAIGAIIVSRHPPSFVLFNFLLFQLPHQ